MRIIKDVQYEDELALNEEEDCKLLMSWYNPFPTPVDHSLEFSINDTIIIQSKTGETFD